jgi:hypothetical protein
MIVMLIKKEKKERLRRVWSRRLVLSASKRGLKDSVYYIGV